jgi:hypothetical protein
MYMYQWHVWLINYGICMYVCMYVCVKRNMAYQCMKIVCMYNMYVSALAYV